MRWMPVHLLVIAAVLIGYLMWVAESRSRAGRAPQSVPAVAAVPSPWGDPGTGVKIVQFYAARRVITRGETAAVCYGTVNATQVQMDPPADNVGPSYNRCVSVSPERTTTYTLSARGVDGSTATASFELQVEPAPPFIYMVVQSAKEIRRGEQFFLCYGVRNASAIRIEPPVVPLAVSDRRCVRWFPVTTTRYTLVATGENNMTDRTTFRIAVR